VEAWVAVGAYPWTQAPLIERGDGRKTGFALGIDAQGRPFWSGGHGGTFSSLKGPAALPLNRWQHLVGTWDAAGVRTLYVQGVAVASDTPGPHAPAAPASPLLLGRSREALQPEGALRPEANGRYHSYFDGALDELRLLPGALTAAQSRARFLATAPVDSPAPLAARVLPAGPAGPGPFGAYNTQLQFYPQWDRLWRTGPLADVVVRFDDHAGRLVFWRGTSYIPHWVTENGIWYTNEFNETWGGIKGCGEPMSDKQCRYSRVAVIESGPARSVVHWRYALTDVFYEIARADADTGWGDWSDEVHTIYPDGTSVRDITLHSSQQQEAHEWHEGIVVMGPGRRPEDCLEGRGLTVLQADGRRHDFDWTASTPPNDPGAAQGACIYVVNTRSVLRPFVLVRPQDKPSFSLFSKEVRREVSMYPWWNHWPASQGASDGRYAFAADRPSHASLHNISWAALERGHHSERRIMLAGLTAGTPGELLPLLRSWSAPPRLTARLPSGASAETGYLPARKAWEIAPCGGPSLVLAFDASPASPVVNPCLELRGWDRPPSAVSLDGRILKVDTEYRVQVRPGLDEAVLLLWLPLRADAPLSLTLVR
jgi:hypothetical protein